MQYPTNKPTISQQNIQSQHGHRRATASTNSQRQQQQQPREPNTVVWREQEAAAKGGDHGGGIGGDQATATMTTATAYLEGEDKTSEAPSADGNGTTPGCRHRQRAAAGPCQPGTPLTSVLVRERESKQGALGQQTHPPTCLPASSDRCYIAVRVCRPSVREWLVREKKRWRLVAASGFCAAA